VQVLDNTSAHPTASSAENFALNFVENACSDARFSQPPDLAAIFPFSLPNSLFTPPESDSPYTLPESLGLPLSAPVSSPVLAVGDALNVQSISGRSQSSPTPVPTVSSGSAGSEVMRAAYHAGVRRKKNGAIHRGSWTPSSSDPPIDVLALVGVPVNDPRRIAVSQDTSNLDEPKYFPRKTLSGVAVL